MSSEDEQQRESTLHPKAIEDILIWAHSTLSTSDNVSKVLRLHALTEHYLDRLLALRLRKANAVLDDARFSYHHKRILVEALGALPSNILESLKRLTSLRNKCAHNAHPSITVAEIQHAAQPIKETYETVQKDHAKNGVSLDEMGAFSWALFSEITLCITPYEIAFAELTIPNKPLEPMR